MNFGDGNLPDSANGVGITPAVAGLLTDESVWVDPPPDLWRRVEADMAGGESPVVRLADRRAARRRPRWLAPLTAAAAAVPMALAAGFVWGGSGAEHTEPDAVFAMSGTEILPAADGTGSWRRTPSGLEIRLDVRGLPPTDEHTYYQGWLKSEQGLVTIGTFHARRGGEDIVLWSGVEDISRYGTLTVTIQEEGGGPASSGKVVMTGVIGPR